MSEELKPNQICIDGRVFAIKEPRGRKARKLTLKLMEWGGQMQEQAGEGDLTIQGALAMAKSIVDTPLEAEAFAAAVPDMPEDFLDEHGSMTEVMDALMRIVSYYSGAANEPEVQDAAKK